MAKLTKKKKRKISKAIYWTVLSIYTLALCAAVLYGLSKVWTYAEEYEASRPEKAINAYIEALNANFWDSTMSDTIEEMEHEVQTDAECKEFVESLFDGGISYARTACNDPSKLAYNLKCENGVIGKVVIAEDESYKDKVEFGMLPWKVDKDEFNFNGLYSSVTVTVPADYSVALNGVTLGPQYIIEEGIHLDLLERFYKDYPNLPTKVTYKFSNIIGHLEPVIYNAAGEEVTIDETKGDSQYITYADDATVNKLTDFVERFEQSFRKYSSGVGNEQLNYAALLEFIIKGGDIDTRLLAAQDGLTWAHTNSVQIESIVVNNVIQLDSTTWIVNETTVVTAYGPQTETTTNDMELVVVETETGDYKIIAIN